MCCRYVIKRDGRTEQVHFDKITARITKLSYGLNPDFCDPVSSSAVHAGPAGRRRPRAEHFQNGQPPPEAAPLLPADPRDRCILPCTMSVPAAGAGRAKGHHRRLQGRDHLGAGRARSRDGSLADRHASRLCAGGYTVAGVGRTSCRRLSAVAHLSPARPSACVSCSRSVHQTLARSAPACCCSWPPASRCPTCTRTPSSASARRERGGGGPDCGLCALGWGVGGGGASRLAQSSGIKIIPTTSRPR